MVVGMIPTSHALAYWRAARMLPASVAEAERYVRVRCSSAKARRYLSWLYEQSLLLGKAFPVGLPMIEKGQFDK